MEIYNPIDLNNNGKWDENEDMPLFIGDLTAWCVLMIHHLQKIRKI
ncbi:MAG: hypothetical protein H6612_05655 [Ignavibacteriales bacterium]|nr:hypothetical protein [Ignavibacteriales bacterium]